jgi:hypothetical protein
LNTAEVNGKRSHKDRARFLDIARGSALECVAIQDVIVTTKGIKVQDDAEKKAMLHRVVAMLARETSSSRSVVSSPVAVKRRNHVASQVAGFSEANRFQRSDSQWSARIDPSASISIRMAPSRAVTQTVRWGPE